MNRFATRVLSVLGFLLLQLVRDSSRSTADPGALGDAGNGSGCGHARNVQSGKRRLPGGKSWRLPPEGPPCSRSPSWSFYGKKFVFSETGEGTGASVAIESRTPLTLHRPSMSNPGRLPGHLLSPKVVCRLLIILLSVVAAGCVGGAAIDPKVQAIIDRLESAGMPPRYQMTYVPISGSPYLACLGGVDIVDMTVDHEVGAVRYQPQRDTPAVVITDEALFIDDTSTGELQRASLTSTPDPAALRSVFGDSLAGYVSDGLQTPDLNTLTLASISVAESVTVEPSSVDDAGHELVITLDTAVFDERVSADTDGPVESESDLAPLTVEAIVDSRGLTTRLVISSSAQESEGNYALTASYDFVPEVEIPKRSSTPITSIHELSFPRPQDSCVFEQ